MDRILDEMDSDKGKIEECISEAVEGRRIWINLKNQLSWEDDWSLIVVPDDGSVLVEALVHNFQKIRQKKYMKRTVIIAARIIDGLPNDTLQVQVDIKKLNCLLRYYRLCQFASNIYVISSDSPYGCDEIIGVKGITVDDYLIDSVFSERG